MSIALERSQCGIAVEEGFTNEMTAAQRQQERKIFKQSTQRRALSFRTEERNLSYIVAPADVFTRMLLR
jgi:hypothetical protein